MSLFLNTLMICGGIATAYVLFHGLMLFGVFLFGWWTTVVLARQEKAADERKREFHLAREQQRAEAKKTRAVLVHRYLESEEVRDVVIKLVDHPYKDGYSRQAATSNKKRNHLLAALRKLVDNAEVREDLYTEPAKWVFDQYGNPSC